MPSASTEVPATAAPTLQQWRIGDVTITKIVESEASFDMTSLFPNASMEDIQALPWLLPYFVTAEGRGLMSIHALVVETPTKRIIVDTCVGNDKDRAGWAMYTDLQTAFLRDLAGAGFARESFDIVLCTHLHMDHVGWNTMLVDGNWQPTFPRARYLLNRAEYAYWAQPMAPQANGFDQVQARAFADSVRPVFDAGLVDLVEGPYPVCEEVELVPTLGHSPGHVSVRISSRGEQALITGDMVHHPCQLAHVNWGTHIDFDSEQAMRTRQRMFTELADTPVLVIGTHWAGVTAGRVRRDGAVFRLECQAVVPNLE